jgi:hypothetical protein
VAFDDQEKVAYLIGNRTLYVVDLSPSALLDSGSRPSPTPKAQSVLTSLDLSTTVNDVIFCATAGGNGYLAVAADGETKVEAGSVTVYSRYLRQQQPEAASSPPSLQELVRFSVGELLASMCRPGVVLLTCCQHSQCGCWAWRSSPRASSTCWWPTHNHRT